MVDFWTVLRWLAIAALVVFVARRKSLTAWILVSMVIGAEIGHDFPGVAAQLRLLSQIFLRLITTIVAPLIFSTLVVGIAGLVISLLYTLIWADRTRDVGVVRDRYVEREPMP